MRRAGPSGARIGLKSTDGSRAASVLGEVRFDVNVHQTAGVAEMSGTGHSAVRAQFLLDQVLNTFVRVMGGAAGNTVAVTAAFQKIGSSFAKHFILVMVVLRLGWRGRSHGKAGASDRRWTHYVLYGSTEGNVGVDGIFGSTTTSVTTGNSSSI